MRCRTRPQGGLSLVEVTIMLLVLLLLTGVLAPSISDFIRDAQWVRAKEDCEAIGVSVLRLVRDVGPCLKFDGAAACTKANRADLIFSDGPDVSADDVAGDAAAGFSGGGNTAAYLNWYAEDSRGDSMHHQLVDNGTGPAYPVPGESGPTAPWRFGFGWRGAYLSPPVGPDPWGQRYLVNTVFLSVARDAEPGTGEGQRSGGWSHDAFCVSAGPNGLFETAFAGHAGRGVSRGGDDLIFIISGDTR